MSPAPCSGSPSQASGRSAAHNYRIRHPPGERHAGCQPAIRPNAIRRYALRTARDQLQQVLGPAVWEAWQDGEKRCPLSTH
jgi:hypothetical protein